MSNEIGKATTAAVIGLTALGGLSNSPPIEKVQDEITPNSSYSQQIDNPHPYTALTHGMESDDQLSEAYQANRENRKNELERYADAADLAQDQAIASGSPEPRPSSMQENTSPTAQTQRESNADLASQMHDSPTGTADVSSEADEGSDTMG